MEISPKKLWEFIQIAESSGQYSQHELNFFYDVWELTRLKYLENKYHKNSENDENEV